MDALQVWAGQTSWGTRNLAYNLDSIPDDKLDWKPSPEANSALEVAHHLVGAILGLTGLLRGANGGEAGEVVVPAKPTTREEARQQLEAASDDYAQFIQTVKLEELGKIVDTPMGQMPFWFLAGMTPIDTIHHHGQIAYIQMLLGDTESHFDMSLMPS